MERSAAQAAFYSIVRETDNWLRIGRKNGLDSPLYAPLRAVPRRPVRRSVQALPNGPVSGQPWRFRHGAEGGKVLNGSLQGGAQVPGYCDPEKLRQVLPCGGRGLLAGLDDTTASSSHLRYKHSTLPIRDKQTSGANAGDTRIRNKLLSCNHTCTGGSDLICHRLVLIEL